jgi:hypothetical protein
MFISINSQVECKMQGAENEWSKEYSNLCKYECLRGGVESSFAFVVNLQSVNQNFNNPCINVSVFSHM